MSTGPKPGIQPTELIQVIAAIMGIPIVLYVSIDYVSKNPAISLVVAISVAVLASVWVVRSGRAGAMEIIIAWLALAAVVPAGFLMWPRTMTVEGIIYDYAGNPVIHERVVLFDRNGRRCETTTDAEGHYQFTGVDFGGYELRLGDIELVKGKVEGAFVNVVQQNIIVPVTPATASPTPIPIETPSPAPTPEPTETLVSTGRLEVTHPLEMIVDEPDVVTVEIMADPKYTEIGVHPPHATGVISIETSGGRVRIEDRIRLYPVMSAELIAANFDVIQGDADPRRAITTTYCAAWTWSIAARKAEPQKITINIFGETTIDGEKRTVLEMSKSRIINVVEKPLSKRILDIPSENLIAIVGTSGPIGLLIMYLTFRENRKLEERIESLENKFKKLENGKEATKGDGKTDTQSEHPEKLVSKQ